MKVIQLHNNTTELIRKAAKNNREAQHVLYELHAPKMLSVCSYYVKDVQKAEEVMLNGFFKAFTHLNSFKNEGSFEGWLRRIMVREAISFLRQQKNVEFMVDEFEFHHDTSSNINTEIEVAEIQQLIDDLPDGYKMIFVMYAIEGYKHQGNCRNPKHRRRHFKITIIQSTTAVATKNKRIKQNRLWHQLNMKNK